MAILTGTARRRGAGLARRWSRLGLRARVTAAFALGALALALILSLLSYTLGSAYLIRQRETSALRQTYVNARLVLAGLRSDTPVLELLTSLETPATSESVLAYRGRRYPSSLAVTYNDLPAALRRSAEQGTPVRQRFRVAGTPRLAVAIPMPSVQATYYEVFSLAELDRTLRVLTGSLLAGAVVTVLLGVGFGRWVSGQALRPLSDAGRAARSISQGRLNTRLDPVDDADLRVLTDSFNDMADALEQRIAREARFASDVSHELRSPLTTLATAVEVLYDARGELPEGTQGAVELLRAEVQRFQRMVMDLLEISRLDAGVAELTLEEVRLADLVCRTVEAHRATDCGASPDAAALPVRTTVDDDVAALVVLADKRRLERVVVNLVDNAQTHGGGLAAIAVVRAGDRVRLLVDDAGPGVPGAYRERIFDRFARVPATAGSRRAGSGVGLGLALVGEHVRLHGGRVWAEERPGGGARFVVELPAERQ